MSERDWWDYFIRKKYPTGRRHCTRCGHWRPITDFRYARLHFSGRPYNLRAKCNACERQDRREREGFKPNYNFAGRKGMSIYAEPGEVLSRNERAARAQKGVRARRKKDPQRIKSHREVNALSARLKRRRQGIPPRRFKDGRNNAQIEYWNSKHPDQQIPPP